MDIEQYATKLERVRWKPDRQSFLSECPKVPEHTLSVTKFRAKCLGGCADDVIAAALKNGHEPVPVNGNGHAPQHNDLFSWKYKLNYVARHALTDPRVTPWLEGTERSALLESLIGTLTQAIERADNAPPPDLNPIEVEEELHGMARVFLDQYLPAQLPATATTPDQLPLELPNLTKTTVEVLDWHQMVTRRAALHRDWAVEGMLARRETSSWSGKVEAGKTTLMRELTMAVIRGEPFLGRNTIKGRVFYAMLDADGEDVTFDEFKKLGFNSDDAPWCKFMFEPNMAQIANGLEQFVKILKDFEPTLVIIDPYPRLKVIEDFHSYTNTYLMGMLSEIAKMIDAHLALPGHIPRGRGDDDDVATAGFGSISFSGGVNARFVVTNRNGIHTVRSSKGKSAGFVPFDAEHTLELHPDTARVSLGEPFSWKDKGRAAADAVAGFLAAQNDRPFDLISLSREIKLQKSVVRTALGFLFAQGRIRREGEGVRRRPFVYSSLTYDGALTLEEVRRE